MSVRGRNLLMLGAVLVAITVVGLFPLRWKVTLATTGPLHRPLHLFAFAVACGVATWHARSARMRYALAAAVFLFGVLLEYMQHAIYGNQFEWRDLADNGVGVAIAVAVGTFLSGRGRQQRQRAQSR